MKNKLIKLFLTLACVALCFTVAFACAVEDPVKTDIEGVTVINAVDGKVSAVYNGQAVTVAYTGTEIALKIVYAGKGETVYEASETAPVNAGSYTVTLSYAGDSKVNPFETKVELEISKAQNEFEFSVGSVAYGEAINPVVAKNLSGGAVSYSYEGINGTDYEASENAPAEIGEYRLTATVAATTNYFGARKTCDFEIESTDPLYGVPEEITAVLAKLTRLSDYTLTAEAGYMTNAGAKLTRSGVIKGSKTNYMIESDGFEHSRLFMVVKSSVANTIYARFAAGNGNTYETVVNDHTVYCKYKADLAVKAGYSVVPVPFIANPEYVGDASAAVTGVHLLLADVDAETEIIGFYYAPELTDTDIPEEVSSAVNGKTELEWTLAPSSYATNSVANSWLSNGNAAITLVNGDSQALELKFNGKVGYKMSFIFKSEKDVDVYFRFSINNASGWADVVNAPNAYANVKYFNEVRIAKGYSLVEFILSDFSGYTGSSEAAVTGVHILFAEMGFDAAIYGVYTQPLDEAPAELYAQLSDKTQLDYSLAAESYETNKGSNSFGGVLMTSGANVEILSNITSGRVYLLVHSCKAVTGYFRFAVQGKSGYDAIMNHAAENVKFFNAVNIGEGYSVVEISLAKFADYTGDAKAKLGGFHINFWGTTMEYFNVFGVWQDPVDEVPANILERVEGKTALGFSAVANGGYMTNSDGKISQDDNGYITVNGCFMAVTVDAGIKNKVYLVVKAVTRFTGYLRFGVNANATYETYVNASDANCRFVNYVTVEAGYSVMELTLAANADYSGENGDIRGMYMQFSPDFAEFKLCGVYVDAEDKVPDSIVSRVAGKNSLAFTAADSSWDTNSTVNAGEDGSITFSNTNAEVRVNGISNKVYIVVKSDAETNGYFRFAVHGKTGYAQIVNEHDVAVKYFNEVKIEKGYSLLEITLAPNANYSGDAEALIGGIHIMFSSKPQEFKICGIYVD